MTLNKREIAIRDGYLLALKKGRVCYLTMNNKWIMGPIKKGGNKYKISFPTPDGLGYTGGQQYIERKFLKI